MSGLADFAGLLARCARNKVPDYFLFYSGVQKIMDIGSPPKTFCEMFAAEIKAADTVMQIYAKRSERGEHISTDEILSAKLALHKLKLLIGCAGRLPSPMSRLIRELAGIEGLW